MPQRTWTETEKKWQSMLDGDPVYEILPMSELYPTLPEVDAYEENYKRFGNPDIAAWCKLFEAHEMCEMVRDTVVLLHGTMNCSTCIRNFHSQLFGNWGHGFAHIPTTAIDRRQVVFGGEEELYAAIKAVDHDYRPKLIMIFTGCAPSLVQDDFKRVIEKAQPEVGAKLHFYSTAGYETRNIGQMIEALTPMWVDLMDPPAKVDPEAVNILGGNREVYWKHARGAVGDRPYPYPSDVDELGRIVEGIGLKVHRVLLASGGDYDYIRTAPEAAVNIISCGTWGFPQAFLMKERFGTQYVYNELPLGLESTDALVRDLAKLTGKEKEAEEFIGKEHVAIQPVWEKCKEVVAGKTVILGGIGNRASSYLRICQELGMEVIYIPAYPDMGGCLDECIKGKRVDWDYFMESGFDPMVLRLKEGLLRDYRMYYLPALMKKLELAEDDVVYMYCDFSAYAGRLEPASIPYMNTSTHLRKRPSYPSRAVGYKGTEGFCLDLMEAVSVSKRKTDPTLYTRIYAK